MITSHSVEYFLKGMTEQESRGFMINLKIAALA